MKKSIAFVFGLLVCVAGAEIAKADRVRAHGWVEEGDGYYTYFLQALENLLREKGIVDASALETKMRAITEAGHNDHDHEH